MTTDPIGTAQERELIERLRIEAKRESEVSRMMAQSKSLRQAGHEPPRDDLYMWSEPEQTTAWKAADALQSRIAEVERLETLLHESLYHLRLDEAAKAYHERVEAALSQHGKV